MWQSWQNKILKEAVKHGYKSNYSKALTEEIVDEAATAAPVLASKAQVDELKKSVVTYFTAKARKQKSNNAFMADMYGANIVDESIDTWVKETKGDMSKLTSYFNLSRDYSKFHFPFVNDFVKKVMGGKFKIVGGHIVKEEVENVQEAIPTAASSGFRTGVVDGKTNKIVFHGTKPQAVSAMKKLNGKDLKRYFLASLTPTHKLGDTWPQAAPSWVKVESVENVQEAAAKTIHGISFEPHMSGSLSLWIVRHPGLGFIGTLWTGKNTRTYTVPYTLKIQAKVGGESVALADFWPDDMKLTSPMPPKNGKTFNVPHPKRKVLETAAEWIARNNQEILNAIKMAKIADEKNP